MPKFQIYLIFSVVVFHAADHEKISEIIINDHNNFYDRSNDRFDKSDNNSDDDYFLYNFFFPIEQDGNSTDTDIKFKSIFKKFDKRISKNEFTILKKLKADNN
jgi:hypothetical protein